MGQQQSSNSKGGATSDQDEAKVDYYQLLGLDQNATDDQIKKAYKKKALELHPDRNYGNTEASTALFAEVQGAYEVLSDAQERAWYDSHRDVILRSGDSSQENQYSHNVRMTSTDDILKLFLKFNPQMEFSDSPTGFFGGLRETFDQLAREEAMTCQLEDLESVDYPSFGSRDDDYNDVVRPFYAAWNGFSTKKTFAWKDIHRYSEAPDRRIRRLMEKENKRLRDEGVREFNDAVRSLVAFARKRDPRCKANAQSEAERQKSLREAAAAQAARSRAANEAKLQAHVIPDWARSEDQEESSSESEVEPEKLHFECVVCRKIFKSERQYEAHERSKKHLKAVKQLRWEMRAQDEELHLDEGRSNSVPSPLSRAGEIFQSTDMSEGYVGSPGRTDLSSDVEVAHTVVTDEGRVEDAGFDNGTGAPDKVRVDDHTSQEDIDVEVEIPSNKNGVSKPIDTAGSVDDLAEKTSTTSLGDDYTSAVKVGKAKQKRARKAAVQGAPKEFKCMTCGASFPSNTQLFTHIRELDHAQSVLKSGKKATGKKKR